MNILMFIDSLRQGGKERRLVELLKAIRQHGSIHVEVVVMSGEIAYPGINDLNIPIHYLVRSRKKDHRIFFRFYDLCKRIRPDIVHAWDSMTAIYSVPVCKILGIRLLNSMITGAPRVRLLSKHWVRSKLTIPFSDAVLANSQAGLRTYGTPPDKSHYIHNGFDFRRVEGLAAKEEVIKKFGLQSPNLVGMVASFTEKKDYVTYLTAAQNVLLKRDDVDFVAVGDGDNLGKMKSIVEKRHQRKIHFLGRQRDVESIVNILDIGVLTTYTEGISNSIMEYMALGKPVIATDGGGTNEIVDHNRTGYLIRTADDLDLSNRIIFLLEHPETRLSFGQNALRRIQEEFSLGAMFSKYYALCNRLLEQT